MERKKSINDRIFHLYHTHHIDWFLGTWAARDGHSHHRGSLLSCRVFFVYTSLLFIPLLYVFIYCYPFPFPSSSAQGRGRFVTRAREGEEEAEKKGKKRHRRRDEIAGSGTDGGWRERWGEREEKKERKMTREGKKKTDRRQDGGTDCKTWRERAGSHRNEEDQDLKMVHRIFSLSSFPLFFFSFSPFFSSFYVSAVSGVWGCRVSPDFFCVVLLHRFPSGEQTRGDTTWVGVGALLRLSMFS